MRVRVRTYGDLRRALNDRITVVLNDGSTVKQLASKLRSMANPADRHLFREERMRGSRVTMLVNGRNIQTLRQLGTELSDGDVVTLIPLVDGGTPARRFR
jgi:MoaD family protein